jgi:putative spermidine/putrescine transport system permease protein
MVKRILTGLTLLLIILPIISLLYLSVVRQWEYPLLFNFSLQHWRSFLTGDDPILSSLLLSIEIALGIASSATIVGFLISRRIARAPGLLQMAYYPYLIAPVIFGVMLQYFFIRMNLTGSLWGVILAQMLFIFPYSILLFATFWNDRVSQTIFQASTLGASDIQVIVKIVFPMARPWIILSFIQCFLISWFEFGITQVIGVGKVQTLTIITMRYVQEANPHLAALASLFMVIPVIILLVINRHLFLKRMSFS